MPPSVLVIDNEPAVREVIGAMLALDGYTVRTAGHCVGALEVLRTDGADLAFLDVHLPGTDGWEILRRLRDEFPALRIVMMSDERHEQPALELGADEFIAKPYTRRDLQEVMRRLLPLPALQTGSTRIGQD